MKLKEILAIAGQPGLFKFIAQSSNGIIVESLMDGKRTNASSASRVSALGEIAVYTDNGETPLAAVLTSIHEKVSGGVAVPDKKSDPAVLKKFFGEVLPDYDQDRVHVSDMKKIVNWYTILVSAGMTDFSVEEEAEEKGTDVETESEE